ncbi:hypothetical protein GCM10010420_00340 [Streptomyces glaucosporus]|uniref:Uncharacterized protein n=1 Tax=Streptomyces glaucosporus TaxID=284044 RepID=A0ABN3HL63_9ACTN
MITDVREREPLEHDLWNLWRLWSLPVPLLAGEEDDPSEPHIWRGID